MPSEVDTSRDTKGAEVSRNVSQGFSPSFWPDFNARFGDGTRAARIGALVRLTPDGLWVQPDGADAFVWPYADLRVAEPVRKSSFDAVLMSRRGGRTSLYVDDTLLLAELIRRARQLKLAHERWRTVRPGLAAGIAAFACYAAIWAFDISPSKTIASSMPERARIKLGETVIRTMPARYRCTGKEGYAALGKLMARLLPHGPVSAANIVVLDLRTGSNKPLINAFAVPGNRLVLTRGIIDQAQSADELAAIIGHEAGHIIEFHPEASLVRGLGFWALVQMVFTGTPGAIGNIGMVLAQLSYTRAAEQAADGHAVRLLREAHISPKGMVDFFRRMEKLYPSGKDVIPGIGARDIFASHPSNPQRIAFVESQPTYPVTPALPDADWKALQTICTNYDTGPAPRRPGAAPSKPNPADVAAAAAARETARIAAEKNAAYRAAAIAAVVARFEAARQREAAEAQASATLAAKLAAEQAAMERDVAARAEDNRRADAALADPARQTAEGLTRAQKAQQEALQRLAGDKATADNAAREAAEQQRLSVAAKADAKAKLEAEVKAAAEAGAAAEAVSAQAKKASEDKALAAKALADKALDDKAGANAEQKTAMATRVPQNPAGKTPPTAEKPGPTSYDTRLAEVNRRIAANPNDAVAVFERGQVLVAKADLAGAIADFTRVIALRPRDANTIFWRASIYARLDQLDPAVADYTAVIALQPKNFAAFNNRGSLFKAQSKLDLALADYTAALAIDNRQAITYTNRALVYRQKHNLDLALADLNAAIAANARYASAYVRRGETYELKSDREAAVADYLRAIKLPARAGASAEPAQTARRRLKALGVSF